MDTRYPADNINVIGGPDIKQDRDSKVGERSYQGDEKVNQDQVILHQLYRWQFECNSFCEM
jgi:hypothetical protein